MTKAPYRSASHALRVYVEARRAAMSAPSSMGSQTDALIAGASHGPLRATQLRHCPLCHAWSIGQECEQCGGETTVDASGAFGGKSPRQSRVRSDQMPREYNPIGDLCAAFDTLSLEDQLVLRLEVLVPTWHDRARRCRACGRVRLGEITEGGLVYSSMCECGERQSERVRTKAHTIADAVMQFRRAQYEKIKCAVREGKMPVWRLLRAGKLKQKIDEPSIGGIIHAALDRWERELRGRGLI